MREDFNLQINSRLAKDDAIEFVERDFATKLLQLRGFKALPRAGSTVAFARRKWGSEIVTATVGGFVGGALEILGPVGSIAGWTTETQALFWNSSERIAFTITAHQGGTTIHVGGKATLDARMLVDQTVAALKGESSAPKACARCAIETDAALWCAKCAAELDRHKVDPLGASLIAHVARRYRDMVASGDIEGFVDVFAPDVVALYPASGTTLSRRQLEAALEKSLSLLRGCKITLNAIFEDGQSYWLAWNLEHPNNPQPRYIEHVRLDRKNRMQHVTVFPV